MYTKDHIYQFLKNNSPHYHYWIHYIIHIPIPNAFGFQLLICCNLKLDASRTHCLFLLTSMSFTKATKTHEISSSKFLCASVVAFPFCASYATTSCNLVVFFFFWGGCYIWCFSFFFPLCGFASVCAIRWITLCNLLGSLPSCCLSFPLQYVWTRYYCVCAHWPYRLPHKCQHASTLTHIKQSFKHKCKHTPLCTHMDYTTMTKGK